jgi:hypothetical protein
LQGKVGDGDGQMPIAGLSKILALESTGKAPRIRASMVSATIDADWLTNSSGRAFLLVSAPLRDTVNAARQQATTKTTLAPENHSTKPDMPDSARASPRAMTAGIVGGIPFQSAGSWRPEKSFLRRSPLRRTVLRSFRNKGLLPSPSVTQLFVAGAGY